MKPFIRIPLAGALVFAGAVVSATTLGAQDRRLLTQPESIPIALATALAATGGFGGEPQILVGALPEWIASRLYIPARGRVLGSAFLGTTVVGVVSLPAAESDTVIGEFKRELLQRGWKLPPPPPVFPGGGFRTAPMATADVATSRLTLCGDQQMVTATAARRRGTSTDVTLRVVAGLTQGTCNPPQYPASMQARSPFPTLYNPPAAADARMTGACSTPLGGSIGTSTTLRAAMAADAILDHYGRQLQDSGWTSSSSTATTTGRTWTRPDSTGAPVDAVLTITTSGRDPACHDVNLQIRTTRRP